MFSFSTWVLEALTSVFVFLNLWVLCFAWIITLTKPWWGATVLIITGHRWGIELQLFWLALAELHCEWQNLCCWWPIINTFLYQKKRKKTEFSPLFSPWKLMSLIKKSPAHCSQYQWKSAGAAASITHKDCSKCACNWSVFFIVKYFFIISEMLFFFFKHLILRLSTTKWLKTTVTTLLSC